MPHLLVSFDLGERDLEQVEQACFASGALAVTLLDGQDHPVLEPAVGEIRLWPHTRVQALYEASSDGSALLAALARQLGMAPARLEMRALQERVWEREWLRDFHPRRFGRRLWVCPHHERVEDPGAVIVALDPGLAFGTGTHASTALCLEWLDTADVRERRVIDYGCGSGILALAAAKLGAAQVFAYDHDAQALRATAENAAANALSALIEVCRTHEQIPLDCDLVMANILSETHCRLAPQFGALLNRGGQLLLSGLLQEQAVEVTHACAPWFDMRPVAERDGWLALAGLRH